MAKSPAAANKTYASLLSNLRLEIAHFEQTVRKLTVTTYWRVGQHIDQHLKHHPDQSGYGKKLFDQLAADLVIDWSTLYRSHKFYTTYPKILADQPKLKWDHYKILVTIEDEKQRQNLEKQAVQNHWTAKDLRSYIKENVATNGANNAKNEEIHATPGRLFTARIVTAPHLPFHAKTLLVDFGFGLTYPLPPGASSGFQAGQIVSFNPNHKNGPLHSLTPVTTPEDERYTYIAYIQKIVDGDTLAVDIACGSGGFVFERLRLRHINTPERDTPDGQKATAFVARKLKNTAFVIVKTYKSNRVDPYGRYLADIFYLPNAMDPWKVTKEGTYLNKELLDAKIAVLAD